MGIKHQIVFILTTLWRNRTTSTGPYPLSIPWESGGGGIWWKERASRSFQLWPGASGSSREECRKETVPVQGQAESEAQEKKLDSFHGPSESHTSSRRATIRQGCPEEHAAHRGTAHCLSQPEASEG